MHIITVLGTRPEITKLSPLLPLLDRSFEHTVIHTGQHYDYNMDHVFFEQLGLRTPDFRLNIGAAGLTHAQQTARMMVGIEQIMVQEKPDWVLVLADPNTPLAGALVASKLNVPLIHMEAGCRSFNRRMPEEINRIVCDHCADLLLAPDEVARQNLLREGLDERIIHVVGSTALMAARRNADIADTTTSILADLSLTERQFVLLTLHRAENTNDVYALSGIIAAMNELAQTMLIVFPMHPRTKKIIEKEGMRVSPLIRVTPPVDYLAFLTLLRHAYFVMSDSGGIQEEAAALDTPCLVLRNETEWTYLLDMGKNLLIGTDTHDIVHRVSALLREPALIEKMSRTPLGRTEDAAATIVEVITHVSR